jgi:hypothetical protein
MHSRSNLSSNLTSVPDGREAGDILAAVGGIDVTAEFPVMPPIPAVLLSRKDLARLLVKNVQVPKRWERQGWITAKRRASGRVAGYDAVDLVRVAGRLFGRFRFAGFDEGEANRLGVKALLEWTRQVVRRRQAIRQQVPPPVFDLLSLAAIAGRVSVLPKGWDVSADQLESHAPDAFRQLIARLADPGARNLMVRAWREAGVMAAAATANLKAQPKSTPQTATTSIVEAPRANQGLETQEAI